jgi:hypothetical protein
MSWQDAVMSFGGVFVAVSLVPMLRAPEKPPVSTSVPLVVILAAISVAVWTLGLTFAALSTVLQCGLWAAMAVMRVRPRRSPIAGAPRPQTARTEPVEGRAAPETGG